MLRGRGIVFPAAGKSRQSHAMNDSPPPSRRHADEDLIRDADLRASLEKARGSFLFDIEVKRLVHDQRARDKARAAVAEQASHLAALPRDTRRRAVIRKVIENEPIGAEHLRFMHTVMAICALPYRALPEGQRSFERKQGRMSLVVEAGHLRSPTGERLPQPVPWGPKARLIISYLTTEAIKQQRAKIEIADTFSGFMREVGFVPTGGPRGNIKPFKEQLSAVAAARMEVSTWDGRSSATTVEEKLFRSVQVWFGSNLDERTLWPSHVEWHPIVYALLERHAMPMDVRVLRAFKNSSRKLDLYSWLTYRLSNMKADVMLTWSAVQAQFGDGFGRSRDFRAHFADDVAAIKEVFPKLPLVLSEQGVTLKKADNGVLVVPKRTLIAKS